MKISKKERKFIIQLGLILITVICWIILIYLPLKEIEEIKNFYISKLKILQKKEKLRTNEPIARANLRIYGKEILEFFNNKLIYVENDVKFIKELEEIAKKNNCTLEIYVLPFNKKLKKSYIYTQVPLKIIYQGTTKDILNALYQVEKMNYLIVIKKVVISNTELMSKAQVLGMLSENIIPTNKIKATIEILTYWRYE